MKTETAAVVAAIIGEAATKLRQAGRMKRPPGGSLIRKWNPRYGA